MTLLTFLTPDKLTQQIRLGNHTHEPILIIRDRKTTDVPTEHLLGRFLEGHFRLYRNRIEYRSLLCDEGPKLNHDVFLADEHQRRTNQADIVIRKVFRRATVELGDPSHGR